jgi:hypothetical protein
MKTFNEVQEIFNSLSVYELIEYHTELVEYSLYPSEQDMPLVYKVVRLVYGEVDMIHLQVNALHWHFASACVKTLKKLPKLV